MQLVWKFFRGSRLMLCRMTYSEVMSRKSLAIRATVCPDATRRVDSGSMVLGVLAVIRFCIEPVVHIVVKPIGIANVYAISSLRYSELCAKPASAGKRGVTARSNGMATWTSVPAPGLLVIPNRAPTLSARSRIPRSPVRIPSRLHHLGINPAAVVTNEHSQ
jgi:hypothetical protein